MSFKRLTFLTVIVAFFLFALAPTAFSQSTNQEEQSKISTYFSVKQESNHLSTKDFKKWVDTFELVVTPETNLPRVQFLFTVKNQNYEYVHKQQGVLKPGKPNKISWTPDKPYPSDGQYKWRLGVIIPERGPRVLKRGKLTIDMQPPPQPTISSVQTPSDTQKLRIIVNGTAPPRTTVQLKTGSGGVDDSFDIGSKAKWERTLSRKVGDKSVQVRTRDRAGNVSSWVSQSLPVLEQPKPADAKTTDTPEATISMSQTSPVQDTPTSSTTDKKSDTSGQTMSMTSSGGKYGSMFEKMESGSEQEQSEDNEPMSSWEKIWANRKFSVSQLHKGYVYDPERDSQRGAHLIVESNLSFESRLRIGDHTIFGSAWGEWSNLSSAYDQKSPIDTDRSKTRNYLHLNQLYHKYSFENSDLKTGKQKIQTGVASLFSPMNRYNRGDLVDPVHPRNEGIWAAGWLWYYGKNRIRIYWMPVFEPARNPPNESRWSVGQSSGGSFNTNFMNLGGNVSERFPSTKPEDWQYLVDYKRTIAGWDLFGLLSHNQFGSIVEDEPGSAVKKKYFEVLTVAGGFSTTYEGWKFYQELLYQYPYDREDDRFYKGVTGIEYKWSYGAQLLGLNSTKLTLEKAYEEVDKKPDNSDLIHSTRESRPGRRNILLRFTGETVDESRYIFSMDLNRDKGTKSYLGGYRTDLTNNIQLTTWAEVFTATSSSDLEDWEDNDRLLVDLKYSI
ncbi:MAG: hypothetical protein ABEJ65_04610 [bacterium]